MPIANAVANCSNKIILDSFEEITKIHIPQHRWLSPRNYYLKDTAKRVNSVNTTPIKKGPMGQYISASVLVHCFDSWNYLSRASESLLNGDISSAIHFIYYSELRSVMSIMASDGLGIFDRRHVWFDSNTNASQFANGTHVVADQSITEWSKLTGKKDVIFNVIYCNNKSLNQWIAATPFSSHSAYSSAITAEWFKKWSIDLRLKADQDLRNEMSYRPHFNRHVLNIKSSVDGLSKIWQALEPKGGSPFTDLDSHLYRLGIEKVYSKWKGRAAKGQDFEKFVSNMFDTIGETQSQHLYEFALRRSQPEDHFIFDEARKDTSIANHRVSLANPFPMFCRAVLLLRMATGVSNQLIKYAPASHQGLRYWWEGICKAIGLLQTTQGGNDASDLFAEIEESITEIDQSEVSNWDSLTSAMINHSLSLNTIKQFQRACFWGMGF